MVWGRLVDAISGKPTLEGEARLPDYFPVEPSGCERHAKKLFECISKEATDKARDLEKMGYAKSYYPDVEAERVKKLNDIPPSKGEGVDHSKLPKPDDNPLDECRTAIAYYKRCCDRELKKKKNWILTEPYRVQEEYRYKKDG